MQKYFNHSQDKAFKERHRRVQEDETAGFALEVSAAGRQEVRAVG